MRLITLFIAIIGMLPIYPRTMRAVDFRGRLDIEVLTIPADITVIEPFAFAECTRLRKIIFIPSAMPLTIGEYAFYGCDSLIDVTLPARIKTLGEGCFYECGALKNAKLPDTLREIPKCGFYGCLSLATVNIPSSVRKIGTLAFAYCESLEAVTFPESLTGIGSNAFSRCLKIREVDIPKSVTQLESYAFSDCRSLQKAVLPANPSLLGELIFSGCEELKEIIEPSVVPPEFECNSFIFEPDDNAKYVNCRLIVPAVSERAYRKAHGWNLFQELRSFEK